VPGSYTGKYLARVLNGNSAGNGTGASRPNGSK
jgi:hypothetical protein